MFSNGNKVATNTKKDSIHGMFGSSRIYYENCGIKKKMLFFSHFLHALSLLFLLDLKKMMLSAKSIKSDVWNALISYKLSFA